MYNRLNIIQINLYYIGIGGEETQTLNTVLLGLIYTSSGSKPSSVAVLLQKMVFEPKLVWLNKTVFNVFVSLYLLYQYPVAMCITLY